MKKFLTAILIVMLTAFLAACGGDEGDTENNQDNQDQEQSQEDKNNGEGEGKEEGNKQAKTPSEDIADDKVVAKVNDAEITGKELKETEGYFLQQYQMMGQDPSKFADQIQKQALDNLINIELVKQAAKESGIKPSEEEINKEYQKTVDQLKKSNEAEDVSKVFEKYDTSEKEVKEDIRINLLTQKYLEKNIEEPTVSDKEIQEAYDKYKAQMKKAEQEAKSLEEMKKSLKGQVKSQKESKKTQALLKQLREENDVEILI
ncbi:hypothetical protein E3U55_07795 [Filobacillus milosensis]|uniref:Peptidylprolyl isomerase n=1 Tax=Filobacillus milosensis TaxID=94137 RepID=A0A4Y8IKR0_9BACI|nr:SurA N-terminal domain-containing protein [Filobacillus milosensis]TFB21726.1 hypothetical protein E3U55_07795 [Filobacillus milosensis]